MNQNQISKVSAFFSEKRRSRREAIQQAAALAAAGVVAGRARATARDGTPVSGGYDPSKKQDLLFVQSFQSGSIVARDAEAGAYTVTLEHGLGQTIYFSDRPSRIVGTTPTEQFQKGLGFNGEDPPNAALVITNEDGGTDVAVVELTNPGYDPASGTATYDMQLLEIFSDIGHTFQSDPVDLSEVAASFGAAHLLIDDCSPGAIQCIQNANGTKTTLQAHVREGMCYQWGQCQPCDPYFHTSPSPCATWYHWLPICNADSFACPTGDCRPYWYMDLFYTSEDLGCP